MFPINVDSPFKAGNGQKLLRSLFYETHRGNDLAIYTLKDKDHTVNDYTYLSLYRLYMETNDLTEYDFASKYLMDWNHWQDLSNASWFRPYIDRWRTELELRLRSDALKRLLKEAVEGGKNSYNANKFLIERGWIPKETEPNRRGRPSKADIQRKAAEELFANKQVNDALNRLEIN